MALNTDALQSLRIDRGQSASNFASRGPRWWWVATALLLAALAAGFFFRSKPIEVSTVSVESSGGAKSGAVLNASGYVVARRIATVSSKVTGRVSEVLSEEGASVAKGQLLARLDPVTTRAQVDLASRELDAAARNLEEIRVRLAESRRNLQRNESLHAKFLISETAVDTSRADVAALSARLTAQQAQRLVAASSLALHHRDLDDLEIRAPFAGVVISKDAQPGEMVSPISAGGGFTRTGIATIVDMDSREIEVDVNESFINRVKDGQKVQAVLDAYPDVTLAAHVLNIVPTADRQKATVKVRIAFDVLDPRILPDMGIKVQFLEDAPQGGAAVAPKLRIPNNALVRDGGNTYVWVVVSDKVERRAVSVGVERDGQVEVVAGVHAGEQLVAPVVEGLRDGVAVRRKANEG